MRMIIFVMSLIFSSSSFANPIEERIAFLSEHADLFYQICFDADGTYKQGITHFSHSTSIRKTAIDCDAQLQALNLEIAAINDQVESLPANCEFAPKNKGVEDLLAGAGGAVEEVKSCPSIVVGVNCQKDMMCNFATSLVPLTALLNVCPPNGTNCFQNALAGIGYSFYDLGCSITSLFGSPCKEDEQSQVDEEATSSDAALMAQFQTPPKVTKFTENPLQWMNETFGPFFADIGNTILERFGCAEWEGSPYLSTCRAPMSWSCADCSIRANMVCGVIGYTAGLVGQEILTGFVIGAAAGIATRAALVISRNAARYFPLSARLGAGGLGLGARAIGRIGEFWTKFKSNRIIKGLSDISSRLGQAVAAGNSFARRSVVISATEDALLAAATRFNDLTEQALLAGYRSTALARAGTIRRLEDQHDTLEAILEGNVTRKDGTKFNSVEEYVEYKNADLSPEERARFTYTITEGDGAQARVIISERKDIDYDSAFKITPDVPTPSPALSSASVDTMDNGPGIMVTGNADYQIARSEIASLTTQLQSKGIDFNNLSLPVDTRISQGLTRDQRTLVLQEVLGRRLQSGVADDLLDEVRFGVTATDSRNFAGRRERVIKALENMGYTPEEAMTKTDELFNSRLLGDVPTAAPRPRPSEIHSSNPARTFDFTQREALENQLSLTVQSNPALRGRSIEEVINEIQRGTRTWDLEPNQAGLNQFFNRYDIPLAQRVPITREWDALVQRRRQITIQNTQRDLQRLDGKIEQRRVGCGEVNKLHPDAFLPDAGCHEIRFTKKVEGEYCTCNLTDTTSVNTRAPGPWLLPCAQIGSHYNLSRGQSDVSALPLKDRALNRCWKVDIEPGVICYHGGLGPTFTGFGGEAQMNCSNKRISPQSGQQPWGDSTGTWSVARYAPISDDARIISITDAGRRCLDQAARINNSSVCSPNAIRAIRGEIEALKRSGPGRQLTAEDITEAEMYVQYLEGKITMDRFGNLRCLGQSELAIGPCP